MPSVERAGGAPEEEAPLRLAVVAALPFPLPQGSQVYVAEQLRALVRAGAEPTLFCYATGCGHAPVDVPTVRVPRPLSPRSLRAGPSPGKPLADAALAVAVARATRGRRFDAVLAHNAEAAVAALAARAISGVPVVYVAHTLLGEELGSYAPARFESPLAALGRRIDRGLVRRADAVLALSRAAQEVLEPDAAGPLRVIPPGLDPAPPPSPSEIAGACARAGVEPGRFALYAGNLDAYQELDDLATAAHGLRGIPVVVATHAAAPARRGLRMVRVASHAHGRALTFGAGAAVLTRRRRGGFPIKLLNYMEAGRAIVARRGLAEGLVHGESALLVPPDAPPEELAWALRAILSDPERADRLGRAARRQLERCHAWPALARETLGLVSSACAGRGAAVPTRAVRR